MTCSGWTPGYLYQQEDSSYSIKYECHFSDGVVTHPIPPRRPGLPLFLSEGGYIMRRKKRIRAEAAKGREPRILVAGLGNLLLRDDGVGVHAVRLLRRPVAAGIRVAEVGCAVFDAMYLLEWAERILLIDAMKAGGVPGTVYRAVGDDIDEGGIPASLHELSIINALHMIDRSRLSEISVIGVEPASIDYGLDLSGPVEAALPGVLRAVRDVIKGWRGRRRRGAAYSERGTTNRDR